jgi:hypothetical protein
MAAQRRGADGRRQFTAESEPEQAFGAPGLASLARCRRSPPLPGLRFSP